MVGISEADKIVLGEENVIISHSGTGEYEINFVSIEAASGIITIDVLSESEVVQQVTLNAGKGLR
jgi:hypothetical protein